MRAVAAALLFLAVRVAVALTQEPFFDELFTVWMARRPFLSIVPALLHDSGPPLYYFLARIPDVMGERVLSIVFASVPMIWLLREKRWTAAVLLAVHPAAAIFAATARPYALCGALIAVAILLLERERWGWAATAMVAAAYTHFAAAFFLPLLWNAGVPPAEQGASRSRPPGDRGETPPAQPAGRRRAAVLAAIAFVPGLLLAFAQPREATAWMQRPDLAGVLQALTFLPEHAPIALTIAAFALTLLAGARSRRYAAFVLLPLALCVALSLLRPSFYPLRFASLLAFPLALCIADSLQPWGRTVRVAFVTAIVALGLGSIAFTVLQSASSERNDYRAAAIALRNVAPANARIVATGYLYLEAVHQLGDRRVEAFPPEQAQHPGWRAQFRGAPLPNGPFIWIGERAAPELPFILGQRRVALVHQNARAIISRVE